MPFSTSVSKGYQHRQPIADSQKTETHMKLMGYILFQSPQTLPSLLNICYNTTTMKNKKRTQSIFSTKFATRHPKNIHPKTDHNQANKNVPNRKFQKVSYTLINPLPDWHNPKNPNVHRNEKQPFCVRF